MASLDQTDYKILEILQQDGRVSYSDLAEAVNLSRASVRERIKVMKETGIIRGFTAIVDAKAYAKYASVFLDIIVEPQKLAYVAAQLVARQEIAIVSQHTGESGLHVHAYIDSVDMVGRYLEEVIIPIDGVKSVHTELLIHQYKTNPYLARYTE